MVVALAMIYFLEKFNKVSSYTLVIAAFIGSLIATGFILLVSRQIKHMATLLIAGTMIGYICSAITDFMITFAEDSDIVNLHGWSQGSFSGMSWSNVKISALIIAVAVSYTHLFLHLLMVHIQQMDFPLKAAQGKRRSLVKVSL